MLHVEVNNLELLLLSEMQLFENLVFPPNSFCSWGSVKLVLLVARLEELHADQMQANIADLGLVVHLNDSVVEGLYGGGVVGEVGCWIPHGHLRDLVWDLEGYVLGGEHKG